jgi:hypothetical protein
MTKDGEVGLPTYLVPDHVGQGADELRGGVAVALEGFLVDNLADGEPEGGFEALGGVVWC